MKTKFKEKNEACKLRLEGKSIRAIASKLNVSSASVHNWCRDIELTTSQKDKLHKKSIFALQQGRKKAVEVKREKRHTKVELLRKKAKEEIGKLTRRERFVIGIALYWAEGFKRDNRLGFANSDPKMIIFILDWLINICEVKPADIRLRVGVNISHKNRVDKVEKHWSELTGISLAQFQKPFYQNFIWKKKFSERDEYFGVLRIRANNQGDLFQKIHGWLIGMRGV